METTRQKKMNRLIQKELATLFQREFPHLIPNALISVNTVRLSPDLGVAKVYISVIGGEKEHALKRINAENRVIRHSLAKSIRNQVRIIPELAFFYDDTLEYSSRIDDILSNLDIPEEKNEDDDKDESE